MYDSYQTFLKLKSQGLRKQAQACIPSIIADYNAQPNDNFVFQLIEDSDGDKIHPDFFKAIVYPALKSRIKNDPEAIRALIKIFQNVYQDASIHKELEDVTKEQLLRRLIAICPNDQLAKKELIEYLVEWLRYTIHEWPSGILYGANGASMDECNEILLAIGELRTLDLDGTYSELTKSVEDKMIEYCARLICKPGA